MKTHKPSVSERLTAGLNSFATRVFAASKGRPARPITSLAFECLEDRRTLAAAFLSLGAPARTNEPVELGAWPLCEASAATRDPSTQAKIFALMGMDDASAQERFGFLLEGLRAGAPPHGGIAFGFDRITMLLSGASSLRDVIAFPKTTAASALFEGAPSPVSADDLRDLHIQLES